MSNLPLYGSAVLIWLPDGQDPSVPGFDYSAILPPPAPNPEPWWLLHEAITYAVTLDADRKGKLPWIKVGEEILSPQQIKQVFDTMGSVSV